MTDALAAFEADLLGGGIVTRVLEVWSGGRVHAEVAADVADASPETRERLGVEADTPLGFRRVQLMRGDVVLSRADNWFVPERLTVEMREALTDSDTPFGVVIARLEPTRETLSCERLAGDPMVRVQALVRAGDGTPVAEVMETYARAVLNWRAPARAGVQGGTGTAS